MQLQSCLSLASLFGSRHHARRPNPIPFALPRKRAASSEGIPAEFTHEQADRIVALHHQYRKAPVSALKLLHEWTPVFCSEAQAECIKGLLDLSPRDFLATLADATEPRVPRR